MATALLLIFSMMEVADMAAPSCRLQLAGHQQLKHSVFTQLRWQPPSQYVTTDRAGYPPEVFDPEGMFDLAHPERVVIRVDGVYRIWTSIKFADRDSRDRERRSGRRAVGIQMNNGNTDILASGQADPDGTTTLFAGIDLPLIRGDRLSVWLEQQSGATIDAIGHSAKDTTWSVAFDRALP